MFWIRKEKIVKGALGPLLIPPIPAKIEFITMLEVLKDAEKYDHENNIEVRDSILTSLCELIEKFKNKKHVR